MSSSPVIPVVRQTVLDTTDARGLAEFYRRLFALSYRAGDEQPPAGQPDPNGGDWLVLQHHDGGAELAFQQVSALAPPTWPENSVPQQLHLDTTVSTEAELDAVHLRVLELGGRLLLDRSDDPEEPLRVFADPSGHPFCVFVTAEPDGTEPAGPIDPQDLAHLRRCVELAQDALRAGDDPFGSVLAAADGTKLAEGRNRETTSADPTQHPEFALARWAVANMTPDERAAATVYTSGEHCPMCAAAHAWAGLGRIVYASSSAQLTEWLAGLGALEPPVRPLPIHQVAPGIRVEGPVPELASEIRELHQTRHAACA